MPMGEPAVMVAVNHLRGLASRRRDPLAARPERTPIEQAAARIAAGFHIGLIAIGTPMALLAAVPPVSLRWLVPAVVRCAAGFRLAGLPGRGQLNTIILGGQLLITIAVMAVVRRAGATAATSMQAATAQLRAAGIDQARRADAATQLRLLHDTALTT